MRKQTTTKATRKRRAERKRTDEGFLEWIETLPSCLTGEFSEWVNGDGRNMACHVRRASEAGTGYKPQFSAVPMRKEEHDLQHQKGETACLSRYLGGAWLDEEAKDWFDERAEFYRHLWFSKNP